MSAVAIRWKNETFQGFWFLTNFLREERLQETAVQEIIKDITDQYEKYRGQGGKQFGPTFRVSMPRDDVGFVAMHHPITDEEIGNTFFHIHDDTSIELIPF